MNEKTRIVFTGDIAFSKHMSDGWKGGGCLAQDVRDYLAAADHVVANIEGPISSQDENSKKTFTHISPLEAGQYLADANIRIWNLANNHVMDNEEKGLLDTIDCAKHFGCQTVGVGTSKKDAYRPIILGNQVKVAVFSFVKPWRDSLLAGDQKAGAASLSDTDQIRNYVQSIRPSVDWVVFVVHGGEEFSDMPMPYIRERYLELFDAGADIIVAHHPHVVQNYERIGRKMIFYSLGNFIFDTDYQRAFKHTENGVLLGIRFEKNDYFIDYLPIMIDRIAQSVGPCKTSAIFCEFNADEYKKLWPIAAKQFQKVRNKKWMITQKRFKQSDRILLLKHNVLGYRQKNNRIILKGRIRSLFIRWRDAKLMNVCDYLQDKID